MTIDVNSTIGTKPDGTSSVGETTLAVTVPSGSVAGDVLVLASFCQWTSGGSPLPPTANGIFASGTTAKTVVQAFPLYAIHTRTIVDDGTAAGTTITVTRGGSTNSLLDVQLIRISKFTLETWTTLAARSSDLNTSTTGAVTVTLASDTNGSPNPTFVLTFGLSSNARLSPDLPSVTFGGPSGTNALLLRNQRDDVSNRFNANKNDFAFESWWAAYADGSKPQDTELLTPNDTDFAMTYFFGQLQFEDYTEAPVPPVSSQRGDLPRQHFKVHQLPHDLRRVT